MKKAILDSLGSIFATSISYFLISLLTTVFFADKGCVRITGIYKDNAVYYRNIELVNYSKVYQNDVYLKLPSTAKIKNEATVSTLIIERETIKSEDIDLYKLNQIEPESSTVIVIELDNETDKIQFTNLKEKNFSLETQGKIESPKLKLIKQLLPNAILYIILFSLTQFISNYLATKRQNELKEKIEEKNKKLDEINTTQNKTESKLKDVEKQLNKTKVFLKKQILDYSKENNFWRNTVRQLLYDGDKKSKKAEHLFKVVTNQLQTYTVDSNRNLNLNEVFFVAEELEEFDKKTKEKNAS